MIFAKMSLARRCALVLACLWGTIATQVMAEPAPERLDLLQSLWHAERSHDLLLSGDRTGAILAALRGLPADPTEADEAIYAQAFEALWQATASFAFRAEFDTAQALYFSADGARAVGFPLTSTAGGFSDDKVRLWDTSDGSLVADLSDPQALRIEFGWGYYGLESPTSPFSPDGRFVALAEIDAAAATSMQGRVLVFDVATGHEVARIRADYFHGFSADSRRIMVGALYEARFVIYDTATWKPVVDLGPLGPAGTHRVAFPGSDGAFYVVTSRQDGSPQGTQLWRLDPADGARPVADLTDIPGYTHGGVFPVPAASPYTPVIAFDTPAGDLVIMGLDGQRLGRIAGAGATERGFAFVRGGQAVAILPFHFGVLPLEGDLAVYALDGTRLEPVLTDLAPFLDLMASTDDARQRSLPYSPRLHPSPIWPTGTALYAQIWAKTPAPLRTQIDAERVVRTE